MSMPELSDENNINREEAVNLILASIAMEELGLSHILNAEGEKLQYVLGTTEGTSGLDKPPTVENILEVNKSIRQTLSNATRLQMMLGTKMESAMSTSTMQGPTGAQGSTGPQGPTGPQGLQGLEGPRGEQGIQGTPGLQGPRGPEGPEGSQGLTGSTGAQGPQGIQGIPGENGFSGIIVRGNYDPAETYSINDYVVSEQGNGFVAHINNPTNPPPEEFVSNNEWTAFVAAGAPGKQGVQGPEGQIGVTGPEGPRGAEGPQGEQGIQGLQGIQGERGDAGSIGPTGPQGPTGPKGDQGIQGPEASSYAIIPFASQMGPKTYASGGNPTRVTLLGFGYFDTSNSLIFVPDTSIALNANGSFNLTSANSAANRQVVFSLPFDMRINSIYATVGNYGLFSPQGAVFPYIQLYSANANSNFFTPLTNAAAVPAQGIGPGNNIPADTMRPASIDELNIELPAGTRIAIGGLMRITGDTSARDYYLYFTGGIGMTRWIR